MFSLIITIISIALVAALALATVYYGGASWTHGQAAAEAARLLNEASQVRGAVAVYRANEGTAPADVATLVSAEYLKTALPGWTFVDGALVQAASSEDACLVANQKLGINTVPSCSDPAYSGKLVCCTFNE